MDLSDASALGEKGNVLAAFKKHRFHREIVNCQLLSALCQAKNKNRLHRSRTTSLYQICYIHLLPAVCT